MYVVKALVSCHPETFVLVLYVYMICFSTYMYPMRIVMYIPVVATACSLLLEYTIPIFVSIDASYPPSPVSSTPHSL